MRRRLHDRETLERSTFDLLIVGGGITGAGVLLEAARKGYRAVLIEKGDFASGTSSRSAKLCHGGLRYLKYAQFGLVMESLRQRDYLLRTYPHLVKPVRFLYPVYDRWTKLLILIGLIFYSILDITSDLFGFRFMGKRKAKEHFPELNPDGLQGCFIYQDGVTSDARLCNEVIHEAVNGYRATALNYFELLSLEQQADGVVANCMDHIEGNKVAVKARYMVNASGPWMDELSEKLYATPSRITAPSKGTHIVVSKDRFPIDCSLVFSTEAHDGRLLYTVPWENGTVIIGSTDTEYGKAIDSVSASISDDEYILRSLQRITPSLHITKEDILCSYAGVRPLLRDGSVLSKDRSREYRIWWVNDRVLNMFGGKLTGFHSMAGKAMRMLARKDAGQHPRRPERKESDKIPTDGLPTDLSEYFQNRYDGESPKLLAICAEKPAAIAKLHPDFDIRLAEVVYFVRFQSCYHLDDVLGRRLSLSYLLPSFKDRADVVRRTANVLREELDWTATETRQEIELYEKVLQMKNPYRPHAAS